MPSSSMRARAWPRHAEAICAFCLTRGRRSRSDALSPATLFETAFERGWSQFENGALIKEAETAGFDLYVTTDKNLRQASLWRDGTAQIATAPLYLLRP